MKKLRTGELRFIAKEFGKKIFGVYDRANGSWPGQTPELGKVKQDLPSIEEAELEAERLNEQFKEELPPERKAKKKQAVLADKAKTEEELDFDTEPGVAPPVEEEPEIEKYEELSIEDAKKYEEGIY